MARNRGRRSSSPAQSHAELLVNVHKLLIGLDRAPERRSASEAVQRDSVASTTMARGMRSGGRHMVSPVESALGMSAIATPPSAGADQALAERSQHWSQRRVPPSLVIVAYTLASAHIAQDVAWERAGGQR
jgi:hypothetical protein